MNEKNKIIILMIEKSLFESGHVLSKASTALIIVTSTLLIVLFSADGVSINIPILNIKTSKEIAIVAMLLIFSILNFRYTVLMNQQKYLFWELTDKGGYREKNTFPSLGKLYIQVFIIPFFIISTKKTQ